jgi:CheY-like chemotaxis protein
LGEGSQFNIILPVHAQKTAVQALIQTIVHEPQLGIDGSAEAKFKVISVGEDGRTVRVLVVDDNSDNRRHLVDYLQHQGYLVDVAVDGISALQTILEVTPDLVLLDIQMPGLSGLDLLRCIRAVPPTRDVAVIAMSGMAMESDRQRCIDAGSNAFLAKPYKMADLKEIMSELLISQSQRRGE